MGVNEEQLALENIEGPEAEAAEALDKLASEAEAENSEAGAEGFTGPVMPAEEEARIKARAFIGMLMGAVDVVEPRVSWPEDIYQQSEQRLGPVMAKYSLTDSVAFRYVEELNAGFFVAGVAVGVFKQVSALKAEDARKAAEKKRSQSDQPTEAKPAGKQHPPLVVG